MIESRYIRMALMFGDNNATTLNRNLEKMISLVLHECYGTSLSVIEIIDELKNGYGLDFAEPEILSAIQGKNQNRIICTDEYKDSSLNKYSITPETKERLDKKLEDKAIEEAINLFLDENKDIDVTYKQFRSTLDKYFYSVFNSNATTISELLDKKAPTTLQDDARFAQEEKININRFLEWDNAAKDHCVYRMVSCCFDYCMMTVKRDKSMYQDMFRKKKFYLDTNIIFRMMGLNRENRKRLIDAFILKCKDAGIELRYTNHTLHEINSTIDNHVTQIRDLLKKNEPISVEALRVLSSKYYNLSFYEAYSTWCNDPANQVGDYNSFSMELKRQAHMILNEFKKRDFDDYKTKKPEEFQNYCNGLKAEKIKRRGYAKDAVVETDINNYMFVRDQNESQDSSDFSNTHYYLISADHILGDWDRKKRPDSVPVVVLPSVWYSLILQYTGRTDNDFESFTRFLNFSLVSREEDEDPRKLAILKKVLELDEPKEIKERTIFNIDVQLQNDYKDFDSVDEMVENAHETVLDQERKRIEEETRQAADQEIKRVRDNAEATIAEMRRDHANAQLASTEKNQQLIKELEQAKKEAAQEKIEAIADAKLKGTMIRYWFVAGLFVVLFLFIAVVLLKKLKDGEVEWLPELYGKASWVIDAASGVLVAIAGFVVINKALCGLDKETIRQRLIDKNSK